MAQFETRNEPPIGVAQQADSIRAQLTRSQRQFVLTRAIILVLAFLVAALLVADMRRLAGQEAPLVMAAQDASLGLERASNALRHFLVTGGPAARDEYQAAWADLVEPALRRLDVKEARRGAPLPAAMNDLREKQRALEQARLAPDWTPERLPAAVESLEADLRAVRTMLTSHGQVERATMLQSVQRLSSISFMVFVLVLAIGLITLLTSMRVVRQLSRAVIEPVERLVEAAAQLAAGQLREDLPITGRDELGRLAKSFNQLRVSLALAEMKYRSLFANTSNSMLLLDTATFQITDANRSFELLTDLKRRQLLQRNVLDLFEEEQRAVLEAGLKEAIAQGQHTVTGIIMTSPAKLMVVLDVRITSVQVSTEKVMELTFIDVTEQYVKNKALSEIAFKDELTGLFNHRSFYQRLNEEIQHARENDRSLVLLFVDLDNFKRCNDTYGHQIGDQLLRNVGGLVRDHIRQDRDAGFRYGGDEFAVLLPEARVNVAERIAHQVREGFESIEQYGTSMSIGVAEWKEGMDAEALVKSADGALYAAKSAGKNTVRISE